MTIFYYKVIVLILVVLFQINNYKIIDIVCNILCTQKPYVYMYSNTTKIIQINNDNI